ncbi:Disease resistance RPP13-like protein 4 [Hordeum vulgare]|nr:Disease resistance RPP13-like protein 4 [Hordeum vulgare]
MGMLKHDTKCHPRLPFSSVLLTIRLRASGHGKSEHLLIGTAPYYGHIDYMAEELDIVCAVAGEGAEKSKIGERGINGTGTTSGTGTTLF